MLDRIERVGVDAFMREHGQEAPPPEETTARREAPRKEPGVRIYVASSWRNEHQPAVVAALRAAGHEVYDFRNPEPENDGFRWTAITSNPRPWAPDVLNAVLAHPIAQHGFGLDMAALQGCDACVLVLPSGRSAHLELGWAAGAGKATAVYMPAPDEPELMYLMLDRPALGTLEAVVGWAHGVAMAARAGAAIREALTATFQQAVAPWLHECFGDRLARDPFERNARFLEEALELVQARGGNADTAHALVDYVFDRAKGDPHQEVGGVMVTLAALCLGAGIDMHAAGDDELRRIWTKVEEIRQKQFSKPEGLRS